MAITGQISSVHCAAPYSAACKGFQQLSISAIAVSLTPPTGATFAVMSADSQSIRYRTDGNAPTSSVGILLPSSTSSAPMQPFIYSGDLGAFQAISVSGAAVLNVEYYGAA